MLQTEELSLENLKARIDKVITGSKGRLDVKTSEHLMKRWIEVKKLSTNPKKADLFETKFAGLYAYVAQLEAPPSLKREKEIRTSKASALISRITMGVLAVLLVTNYASTVIGPRPYIFPDGWFINHVYLGFVLAGVTLNILLKLRARVSRGDLNDRFWGIYSSRILQAVVYAALIYWYTNSLSANNADKCAANGLDPSCLPFATAALLVGLFVHLIEDALMGIGERFVDMISSLLSTSNSIHRQRERNNEMRKQLDALRSKYLEFNALALDETKMQNIKLLFEDTLMQLQNNENDYAEANLQDILLELKSLTLETKPPTLTVEPPPDPSNTLPLLGA
jgi:hypothetical protein